MKLADAIQHQRVKHIIQSYGLDGDTPAAFATDLAALSHTYPGPLIELAIVETLVQNWLRYPLPRGDRFLAQVQARLQRWQHGPIFPQVSPIEFQHITGLHPDPVFSWPTICLPLEAAS